MDKNISTNLISPLKVIRGEGALNQGAKTIPNISRRPILIGRSEWTKELRHSIKTEIEKEGVIVTGLDLEFDCCEIDLNRIEKIALDLNCDGVIAAGGGKVLDAGKLIANRINLPSITIPTSAATCAGWTALSNIYSCEGKFVEDKKLTSCPELLIFDHEIVRTAPPRTLASGVADGLAKWYEASLASSSSNDGMVQQAVQMARVLRDQLFLNSRKAFSDPYSQEWITVAEGCALTAGLIGGIGGAKCRTAAAHPIHNGLTQLKFKQKPLHGEIVCFGILVQLALEESSAGNQLAKQARLQLNHLIKDLKLPSKLEDLHLTETSNDSLLEACKFACKEDSDIHKIPFTVQEKELLKALRINGLDPSEISLINKQGSI